MIEIAFDKNSDNKFQNKCRPLFEISSFKGSHLADYQKLAREIIQRHQDEYIIIIRSLVPELSLNMLALALFIESGRVENKIECAVLKVNNYEQALVAYKPYVALTIGIKLAIRLCHEDNLSIYREIENMGYLGLDIKRDYFQNKIISSLPGDGETLKIQAYDAADAIVGAATLKALSLAKCGASVVVEFDISNENVPFNEDEIIYRIVENARRWID